MNWRVDQPLAHLCRVERQLGPASLSSKMECRSWENRMRWCGALLLLVLLLAGLFGADCRADAVKETPDFLVSVGKNNVTEDLSLGGTVPVEVKGGNTQTAANVGIEGGARKGPEKKGELIVSEKEMKSIEEPKGGTVDVTSPKVVPKENVRGEVCDVSNRCADEKSKFVACLRVPGNDSPSLSLLIQNRGAASLSVGIYAPQFVTLEQNISLLHAEEDKKVKVSVQDGVTDSPIVVTVGEWHCNLSFWEMLPDSTKKSKPIPTWNARVSRSTSYIYLSVAALVIIGAALFWIQHKRGLIRSNLIYQKVDATLPVSSGGIKEADLAEGWDNSWGDSWDEEEAPITPSTPSLNLSSKGLASRRIAKEGWKD